MPSTAEHPTARKAILAVLAGLAYCAVAKLSLELATLQSNTSPFWPPSGIATASLLIFGKRWWPVLFLSSFSVNVIEIFDSANTIERVYIVISSLSIATGNTLEALCGRYLINRFANGTACFLTSRHTTRFIVLGAFVPPLFSVGLGIGSLLASGLIPIAVAADAAITWYLANAVGIMTFSSVIIAMSGPYRQKWTPGRQFEFFILCTIFTLISRTIPEIGSDGLAFHFRAQSYIILPTLLYISFRFRITGATLTVAIALIATVLNLQDNGASSLGFNYSLLHVQLFVGVISATCLSFVALLTELDRANAELSKDVDERSNRIKKILLEKDEMMAAAAHDLQAPLVSMRNVLALLQAQRAQTPGDDLNSRLLSDLKSTCSDLIGLISRMLDAHRVETIAERIKLEPINITPVVEDIIERRKRDISLKGVQLKQKGFKHPSVVMTDLDCFSRVTSNLIDNAIAYCPADGKLEVKLSKGKGNRVELSIYNDGPSIPPDQRDKLFSKFSRFRFAGPESKESHGFGLYIVKKLLDSSRGTIHCECPPHGGCRFTASFEAPPH